MSSFAYYNGTFDKKENIRIPLTDRSIFFGDAVYEAAIGCYDRILWEEEHFDRLLLSARALEIKHPYSTKDLTEIVHEVAIKSMLKSYLIYVQLSRTHSTRKHSATECGWGLLITVDEFEPNLESPPMKLLTEEDFRYGFCNVKTVNLLPAVLASTKAENSGCDEAVFIKDGYVTECAKSNISIIKRGRLVTHPNSSRILPGITRSHLLSVCTELGIEVSEQPFTKDELFSADEVLVTSSTKLLRSVSLIDNIPVGGRNKELIHTIRRELNKDYFLFVK